MFFMKNVQFIVANLLLPNDLNFKKLRSIKSQFKVFLLSRDADSRDRLVRPQSEKSFPSSGAYMQEGATAAG